MNTPEQTLLQIERFIRKIADKFPVSEEASILTDVHLRVNQDTGELVAFDDDDNEITRVVVESWIGNTDDDFNSMATSQIRKCLERHCDIIDNLAIFKPYSFVLEDDECYSIAELYVADGDTMIIDTELMKNLDSDLDEFLKQLLEKE